MLHQVLNTCQDVAMRNVQHREKIGTVSPNQPKTPMRGVRLPPALWDAVQREAQERGVYASDVMREAIAEHVERRVIVALVEHSGDPSVMRREGEK